MNIMIFSLIRHASDADPVLCKTTILDDVHAKIKGRENLQKVILI